MPSNRYSARLLPVIAIDRQLGAAIDTLLKHLPATAPDDRREALDEVVEAYRSMQHYFREGIADPDRQRIYVRLLRKVYTIAADSLWEDRVAQMIISQRMYGSMPQPGKSHFINAEPLERYVQDRALLALNIGNTQTTAEQLYYQHHDYLNRCFIDTLLMPQWDNAQLEAYYKLMLANTIDESDRAVLLTAVTINCISSFDILKLQLLYKTYTAIEEPLLRRRAFIGLALAWSPMARLYETNTEIENALRSNAEALVELLQLMIRSNQSDQDAAKIRNEILPNIIEAQKQGINLMDIDDLEGSSLNEILEPEKTEDTMNRLENGMQEMVDMLKDGADIYFGQFAQMKRGAFFGTLGNIVNWFLPFDPELPPLNTAATTPTGKQVLRLLSLTPTFCDSDKYALALNINRFISMLPANAVEALSQIENLGPMAAGSVSSSPLIDPGYVKDLYRFFRLNDFRKDFTDPFDLSNFDTSLAHIISLLPIEPDGILFQLLQKCYKEGLYEYLHSFFHQHADTHILSLELLRGKYLIATGDNKAARETFEQLYETYLTHPQVMLGLAYAYFRCQQYEKAEQFYTVLHQQMPSHLRITYALCRTWLYLGKTQDVVSLLSAVAYQHPKEIAAKQLLAHAYLLQAKPAQAQSQLAAIADTNEFTEFDTLLMSLSEALQGQIAAARQRLQQSSLQPSGQYAAEVNAILSANGKDDIEQRLLLDALNTNLRILDGD